MAIKINGTTVIDDSQAFTSTSTVSATGTITGGNIATAGTVSATGNVTAANLFTAGVISATGNIIGGNIVGTIAGNVTTAVVSASGNITGGNLFTAGVVSAAGNVRGGNINTAGTISATGDLFGANAVFAGNLQVNGNITYINSNVVTINDLAINLANNAANVSQTNNGGLELGPQGSPFVTFLYNSSANTWVSSAGLSATGNVTGSAFNGAGTGLTGTAASLTVGTATVAGTVTTAAQPNITSVGTLTSLNSGAISSSGNITGGNLSVGTGTVTAGNIVNGNGNGVGNIGSASNYFNTVFAQATSAQYADLAEKYTADADYEPGTVVMFGGSQEVTVCTADACRRVAGVISTNPSYIMNGTLEAAHVATVALTGRVPCRVTGTVRKGDLMVSAGNGQARAEADPAVGAVIGKALADHDSAEGVIEVVVGRF